MAETPVTVGWWPRLRGQVARGGRAAGAWLGQRSRTILRPVRDWGSRHALGITITLLITAFLLVFFWEHIVISVYPGQVGVLWRRFSGTVIHKVYGEGVHLVSPLNIMYIYDVRWHVLQRSVTILTRDGLEVQADLALLYHVVPERAAALHKFVGPTYVDSLITPALEAAARNVLGQLDTESVYVQKEQNVYEDAFERELTRRARSEGVWHYIEVQELSVLRLTLPSRIQEAIQQKREEEQLALLYDFRLGREEKEAERKRIEARGIRDFQDIITGGLNDRYLVFKGIEATLDLAKSPNTKVIVFGDKAGLPLLLGNVPTAPGEPPRPE